MPRPLDLDRSSAREVRPTRRVDTILPSPEPHWVGDGFPVASVVSPQRVGTRLSPIILMDYGGPIRFEPAESPRGVDSHPHRGFETVTLVFHGELEHRDSAGNHGSIGPGDVQWMTAARGVLHEEKHSAAFTRSGGDFEVAQLWVNLPAAHKMSPPRYQELRADSIATAPLVDGDGRRVGSVRVIAGDFDGAKGGVGAGVGGAVEKSVRGAATTVTPITLWDATLRSPTTGGRVTTTLPLHEGHNIAVFVRSGTILIGAPDPQRVEARSLALLQRDGDGVTISADGNASFLVLGGAPIDEPMATYGPFVMNTDAEIKQAISDFRTGAFGTL